MNKLLLESKEKKALKTLKTKSYRKMTSDQKEAVLTVGAKDLVTRFTPIFKKLANE